MTLICQGSVQYVNCCYTREKITLVGDRRTLGKSQPTFELLSDNTTQQLQLKVLLVLPEEMYRTPKEHVDIYILKPGTQILRQGLEQINAQAAAVSLLDRGNRDPRDPDITYDDSGVPLRIDSKEAWVKVSSVKAYFIPGGFRLESNRANDSSKSMPRLNIDVEIAKSRLHIGVEIDWNKINAVEGHTVSSIEINLPWSEGGHLLTALNGAVTKMK